MTRTESPARATPSRFDALAPLLARYPWAQRALLAFPLLAVAGPFASVRPGASGFPYLYRVLWALCLLVAIPLFVTEVRRRALPLAYSLMVLVYAVWAPITLAWSPAPQTGRTEVLAGVIAMAGSWVALVLTRGRSDSLRLLRRGWIVAFVASMVVVTWEFLTGRHLGEVTGTWDWVYSAYSVAGLDTNPNGLSNFCVAASGVMCAQLLRLAGPRAEGPVPRWRVAGLLAGLVAAGYTIYLTGSRAGIMSLIVILVGAALWCLPTRRRLAVPALLLILAAALPVVQDTTLNQKRPPAVTQQASAPPKSGHYQDGISEAQKEADVAGADKLRKDLSLLGLRYLAQRPLQGHGAGAALTLVERDPDYEPGVPAKNRHVLNLHNTYLEIGVNYGLIGLVPILAIPLWCLWIFLRPRALRRTWPDPRVYEGLAILLALLITSIITSTSIGTPSFWLLAAYASALAWNYGDATREPSDTSGE